jgi:aerobic-type carbon monoxide dehydrogenase small subunit (CoxS/CutS family)
MILMVNGKRRRVNAHPMKRLLDVLRDDCGLTGTKEGCGEGECGACTVLLDGVAVDSCLVPAAHAEGRRVTTIEGASGTRAGKALQRAFVEHGGAQCGICTPGMIVAAMPLARRPIEGRPTSMQGRPTTAEIKTALAGNLCRCTGYLSIFRSVEAALWPPRRKGARGHRA